MPDKIKIIFLLPALNVGGAEMVFARLMNNINREEFTPSFISVSSQGQLGQYINSDVDFQCLNRRYPLLALFSLVRALRKQDPDIVVSTMAHTNFAALAVKTFFRNVKFIVRESTLPDCTLHGRGALKPFIKLLYKILYPYADTILAPAQIILDRMSDELYLSPTKMALLPNPIIEPSEPIEKTDKNSNKISFIAVGRLHYEKGFDRLLEGLGHWNTSLNWELKILGEGNQKKSLENLIRKYGLEQKVFLAGFQKNPSSSMAEADYFLLPSRWEGMPNAALEALACGTPVLAVQEAGGILEIAQAAPENAVTIFPDIQTMLNAINDLKPDRKEKGNLLPAQYRFSSVVDKFETMLKNLYHTP